MKEIKKILDKWWDEIGKFGAVTDYHMTKLFIKLKKREINLFKLLESKRITDNVDYISIPLNEWDKIKGGKND